MNVYVTKLPATGDADVYDISFQAGGNKTIKRLVVGNIITALSKTSPCQIKSLVAKTVREAERDIAYMETGVMADAMAIVSPNEKTVKAALEMMGRL
jgi:ribosomal protein L10